MDLIPLFAQLRLQVLQRGWLSSNNIVFQSAPGSPTAVVDTGYAAHAAQTVALIGCRLAGEPLTRIFNTHLHSDHCGGNAALQRTWGSETAVPAVSFAAVSDWDQDQLTFNATAQRCDRFAAHTGLEAGATVLMGGHRWRILEAPGHDADALMFFEPNSRVLISGDALWESRLAIVFPEFEQMDGFGGVEKVLDVIAALNPSVVIPGHGRPFSDVPLAVATSLRKLQRFQLDPAAHRMHATRALTMFHMLEVQHSTMGLLVDWMLAAPIFRKLVEVRHEPHGAWKAAAEAILETLILDGILFRSADVISVEPARSV